MTFYSTNNSAHVVPLREALFNSLPVDNGLYMPTSIPKLPDGFLGGIINQSLVEIAYKLSEIWLRDELTNEQIEKLVTVAFPFDTPLVELEAGRKYVLELFHGPSLAFKDVGARFMAGLMSIFATTQSREIHILVATSGDTGGAVAMGFHNVPGIRVSILYPKGRVSVLQEKQLTTLGGNIQAYEVDGSFDDCQAIVKQAFLDPDLTKAFSLSSANSINIFRLIPQSFYYFRALAQLNTLKLPIVFSTPSGNFGNLSAGVLGWRMGMPVQSFIAATNLNKVVPSFLESGNFVPTTSLATLSNAMDVGNPSNLVRLQRLTDDNHQTLTNLVKGYYFTDDQTISEMISLKNTYNYLVCPHTAIGLLGLNHYSNGRRIPFCGVALATAHPAKFSPTVDSIFGFKINVPEHLNALMSQLSVTTKISARFSDFKEIFLHEKYAL